MSSQVSSVPLGQAVLDVVQCRVHEYASVVPSAGLDPDRFVDERMLAEVLV